MMFMCLLDSHVYNAYTYSLGVCLCLIIQRSIGINDNCLCLLNSLSCVFVCILVFDIAGKWIFVAVDAGTHSRVHDEAPLQK